MKRIYYSLIYNLALLMYKKESKIGRIVHRVYNKLLCEKDKDTSVISCLNHQFFSCPYSHKLLFYQKDFPLYDRQFAKLCNYIYKIQGRTINIIDVGANVGDTVMNIGVNDAFYLCVEGDKRYSKYIKTNLRKYNYALEECFLSDIQETASYDIEASSGTGHLIKSENENNDVKLVTLDNLIREKYSSIKFDLLIIDTDGFDFKVIRGAKKFLKNSKPLLFFEWDKMYCEQQGEDTLSIFPFLNDIGYDECILFDNYGNLMKMVNVKDLNILKEYIDNTRGEGLPYYYDVLTIPPKGKMNSNQYLTIFSPKNAL